MTGQDTDDLIERLRVLEAELEAIKERNVRVESDKAWEVSRFRVFVLTGATYALTAMVFLAIGAPAPLLNALIPTTGYYVSTQTVPILKRWWLSRRSSGQ